MHIARQLLNELAQLYLHIILWQDVFHDQPSTVEGNMWLDIIEGNYNNNNNNNKLTMVKYTR